MNICFVKSADLYLFCYIPGISKMYGSQKSVLRSNFVLVFIDFRVYRLNKTSRFVFVLLYSWEHRNASITRIGQAEQICIGFIDSWLHSLSKTNSFVFVFVYYCKSQEASLRKIGFALSLPQIFKNKEQCFGMFLNIFRWYSSPFTASAGPRPIGFIIRG